MSASVVSSVNLLSMGDGVATFIRRDASTVVASGITILFADGGSKARIKNGMVQIRHDVTGLWHSLHVDNNDEGVAQLYIDSNDEAED